MRIVAIPTPYKCTLIERVIEGRKRIIERNAGIVDLLSCRSSGKEVNGKAEK